MAGIALPGVPGRPALSAWLSERVPSTNVSVVDASATSGSAVQQEMLARSPTLISLPRSNHAAGLRCMALRAPSKERPFGMHRLMFA